MYYDDSGNSAIHAIRGAWWTGTRIGAGINYGIQAATGASLGILLYETFNDGIDFGDIANDDTYEQCPSDEPEDPCKEKFQRLKHLWLGISDKANAGLSKNGLRLLAESYNKERDQFITECPHYGAPPKMNIFNPFN